MSSCVHMIEDRVEVFWGGYSMVKAELALLQTAMRTNDYSKFLLLSDDSFPILPPDHSMHILATARTWSPSIRSRPTPHSIRATMVSSATIIRDRDAFPTEAAVTSGRSMRIWNTELPRLKCFGVSARRKSRFITDPSSGTTRDTVKFLLNVCQEDLHLVKSFEYSALPDETMVQSIIGNYRTGGRHEKGPVYADFSAGGPRVLSTPAELPLDFQDTHAFVRRSRRKRRSSWDRCWATWKRDGRSSGRPLGALVSHRVSRRKASGSSCGWRRRPRIISPAGTRSNRSGT